MIKNRILTLLSRLFLRLDIEVAVRYARLIDVEYIPSLWAIAIDQHVHVCRWLYLVHKTVISDPQVRHEH